MRMIFLCDFFGFNFVFQFDWCLFLLPARSTSCAEAQASSSVFFFLRKYSLLLYVILSDVVVTSHYGLSWFLVTLCGLQIKIVVAHHLGVESLLSMNGMNSLHCERAQACFAVLYCKFLFTYFRAPNVWYVYQITVLISYYQR